MLKVNHIIVASILLCMASFSPMAISMMNDTPRIATIANTPF